MGFFSKLFGKKDETETFIKNLMKNKRKAEASANYEVTCSALKTVFYSTDFPTESFYNNLESAKGMVQIAIEMCSKKGIRIPNSYRNLPITFVSNKERSKFGYIVDFDDAKNECECNYVGMIISNGVKKYYTNEYYEFTNRFGLCMFKSDGGREFGLGSPRTFEEFKDAIVNF